jgi:hypothetical protein
MNDKNESSNSILNKIVAIEIRIDNMDKLQANDREKFVTFLSQMISIERSLQMIAVEIKVYNDSGLPELIKDFNNVKGFRIVTRKYSQFITKTIFMIVSIAGILSAIHYYITHQGTWPK